MDQVKSVYDEFNDNDLQSENIQKWLQIFFRHINKFNIEEVHDFGVGQFDFYKYLNWPMSLKFKGFDNNSDQLTIAEQNCVNPKAEFVLTESFDELPGGSKNTMLVVKDVLYNWEEEEKVKFLDFVNTKYKWVLVYGDPKKTIPENYRKGLIFFEDFVEKGIWKFNNDPEDTIFT